MASNSLYTRFLFLITISLCIIALFSDLSTSYEMDSLFGELEPRDLNFTTLEKRDNPVGQVNKGDITFYDVGLGACGKVNSNSDLICALSPQVFGTSPGNNPNKNPNCGRQLQVTCGSKSVVVTAVDRCAGCGPQDVDLSPSAFGRLLALA
ncbi:5720_t:CDS:1, partial [Cetraspora pellucida]